MLLEPVDDATECDCLLIEEHLSGCRGPARAPVRTDRRPLRVVYSASDVAPKPAPDLAARVPA
jgi:hypothetical protein